MVSKKPDGQCQLHNVQFYNLKPRGIVCSAISHALEKLAVARDDGTIEIWNIAFAPFLEKTIMGGEGVSVEGLAWAGGRLFSASLAGTLIEWNLKNCVQPSVKQSIIVTGNAAWCVDVSRDERLLAVGTEGGYINVYRLDDDEITYERILDKQEGRILCCKFDWTGDFLVTGSTDAVRVWDVRNGHAVHKMSTGRSTRSQETTVWAVCVLKDFTILSADSRGRMVMYDGHMGTVLETYVVSKADLLCLAMDERSQMLFVGGVEPIIRGYKRIPEEDGPRARIEQRPPSQGERNKSFVRTTFRRCHTHDIKTLALFGKTLFSGGVDGTLAMTSFPPFRIDTYLPMLPGPAATVATNGRLVLLKYINYLEVWTLAPADKPAQGGKNVLQIRSKNDQQIACAAMSSNGRFIVYSTESTVRLLRFDFHPKDPAGSRVQRVRNTPEHFRPCYRVDFTHDSRGMFLYARDDGSINYFHCPTDDGDEWDHKQTFDANRWLSEMVHLSAVSHCGRYLVCADLASSIVVFERTATKWKRSITLPRYKLPPTAMAVQPGSTRLAVAFADHKLFLYDFEEFSFVFSTYLDLHRTEPTLPNHPISGIAFDPRQESAMVLQNGCHILTLRFGADIEVEQQRPSWKKKRTDEKADNLSKYRLRSIREAPRLVAIQWLDDSELVAIQANGLSMVEHLPAPFRQKAYGKE